MARPCQFCGVEAVVVRAAQLASRGSDGAAWGALKLRADEVAKTPSFLPVALRGGLLNTC
ncbi:MAG: hypothetical protein CMP23_04775 [Rickettsiales bacterium]|nr:hypothetical protein [Rickettsiales bacterium]